MAKRNSFLMYFSFLITGCCFLLANLVGQDADLPKEPFLRGKVLLERGKHAEAKTIFDTLLKAEPKRTELLYYRGVALLGLANPDQAWADFTRTTELEPGYAMGLVGQAQVWVKRKQYDKAMNLLNDVLKSDGKLAAAYFQKGIVLGWQKKTADAIQAFQKCLEMEPTHAQAHYQIGLAYNQQKRKDMSIRHLEKFLALSPLAPEAEQVRSFLNNLRR